VEIINLVALILIRVFFSRETNRILKNSGLIFLFVKCVIFEVYVCLTNYLWIFCLFIVLEVLLNFVIEERDHGEG
jgi:predicted membrane protein